MLVGGLIVIFVGIPLLIPGEPKPVDFCDTISAFEDDPDYICAERFEDELRELCSALDPDIETCMLLTTLQINEICVDDAKAFGISEEKCFYKNMKNLKSNFENWQK